MANAIPARRRANVFFGLGWLLTLMNIAGIAFAIWLVLYFRFRPDQEFFFLDEQVVFVANMLKTLLGIALFGTLQIFVLPIVSARMVDDIPEIGAAEAALKIARGTAVCLVAVCVLTFIFDLRAYRTWSSTLELRLES